MIRPAFQPLLVAVVLLFSATLLQPAAVGEEIHLENGVTITIHDEPIPDLAAHVRPASPRKISLPGDWLVLPRFEVDTTTSDGVNTFFAVRNITDTARNVTVRYHSDNQMGMPVAQMISLGPKESRSFSLATVAGLQTDVFGIARGYVDIIEEDAISLFPRRVIQGDYFRVDTANNFASGDRLLNYTNFDEFYDLCQSFQVRFFNGGDFDGGTTLTVFSDVLQTGNEFFFSVYEEAGGAPVRTGGVSTSNRSASFPASFLADTTQFGYIEIVFDGTVGHISGVFSALGRFSVGVDASCIEPTVFP